MEKYRKSLRIQNLLILASILCLVVMQILACSGVFSPAVTDVHWRDMYAGFIAGAAFAMTILFVIGLVKNLRALRSEATLKKLYAKENDERWAQVCSRAQSGAYRLCTMILLVAIIVTGYFSIPVSLTCLTIVLAQSIIGALFKLYWHRKL